MKALFGLVGLLLIFFLLAHAETAPASAEQLLRGQELYVAKCLMCHQASGTGVPGVFPPLAQSDWLLADRKRAIRVLCEGLSGPIKVNGATYAGAMPAQMLDNAQLADVLTYIGHSWGNTLSPFTPEEVQTVRSKTRYPTYEALVKAAEYRPLPPPPPGWEVREVAQLSEFCTRITTDPKGRVFLLGQNASVHRLDVASGAVLPVFRDYPTPGSRSALGFCTDPQNRLWIVTNQRLENGGEFIENEVVIWRTSAYEEDKPTVPEPWFTVRYPYGVGPYNHGASHIGFGPDGLLYVNSGSRTDGGEEGTAPRTFRGGETPATACIWRFDPKTDKPEFEVLVRGIRNAFGFAWDSQGRFFTVSNGPDADAPEEMDFIEPGKHYGFPFQFSDWPAQKGSPYPHTPEPPTGITFTKPVANVGPAAGGKPEGLYTFDPHSCPGGMVWCDERYPEPLTNRFIITRFGNLLPCPDDVGFDVLAAKMQQNAAGEWTAHMDRLLGPLGRPLDVTIHAPGRLLILEYTRPTDFKNKVAWLPGRVIELYPAATKK